MNFQLNHVRWPERLLRLLVAFVLLGLTSATFAATATLRVKDPALAKELLRLYAGHFLEKESEEAWAISARDKLKAKFIRSVTLLGTHLEESKDWEQAISLYSRALELDNLSEALYRRLMICHREHGEPAEALNVYRRCRDMLSIVLGMKPSTETESVRQTLST